jgi:hypothetical protein
MQKLLHEKNKPLAVAFNSIVRYTNDALSINNKQFHSFVDSIYLSELEINHLLLLHTWIFYETDAGGIVTNQLYDKRDYFNFATVNFQYTCICNNIHYHLHMAYRFDIQVPALHTIIFMIRGRLLTDKLMLQGSTVSFVANVS